MKRAIFLFILSILPAFGGVTRDWTNAEGTKHFSAEFIGREKGVVSLRRKDGKDLTMEITKLHQEDQDWINLHYPVIDAPKAEPTKPQDQSPAFDTLKFGDDRKTVSEKLSKSKLVETSVDGVFQGRTGLNGIYRTRQKLGGLYCYLFFDWTGDGTLKEINLQTENQVIENYRAILEPCWKELAELIVPIHGKPIQSTKMPNVNELADGQMLASHLWATESGGSVMLGTSRVGDDYQVIVRFTNEAIEANRISSKGKKQN